LSTPKHAGGRSAKGFLSRRGRSMILKLRNGGRNEDPDKEQQQILDALKQNNNKTL